MWCKFIFLAFCSLCICQSDVLFLPPVQGVPAGLPMSMLQPVAFAQGGGSTVLGGTSVGPDYICVPVGTCPTSPPNVIDPRIVTPGQLCPAGQEPCYGQVVANVCGIRNVPTTNTGDGFADPGAYPWQAYLRNQTSAYAGSGVLIDQYHVLTAAHKVYLNRDSPGNVVVFMGIHNPSNLTGTQNRTVVRIVVHPSYNPSTLINDIAILRLNAPIVLGTQPNINAACMPTQGQNYIGQTCTVSGWGQTSFATNDAPTNPMKQVQVPLVNYATCRASMSNATLLGSNVDTYLDPNGEICAGGLAMRDACSQDGGSPLVCYNGSTNRYQIAGLVIWGKGCGRLGVYGVYVSIPYYVTWITNTTNALNMGK